MDLIIEHTNNQKKSDTEKIQGSIKLNTFRRKLVIMPLEMKPNLKLQIIIIFTFHSAINQVAYPENVHLSDNRTSQQTSDN